MSSPLSRDSAGLSPADEFQANLIALRLRHAGLSYPGVSAAMLVVYGIERRPDAWRHRCRLMGAPPKPYGLGRVVREGER